MMNTMRGSVSLVRGAPTALLVLVLLSASARAVHKEQWSRPSPIFPGNHRRGVSLETASSSDINALAVPDTMNFSDSKNVTEKRIWLRPGSVTNLGLIPLEDGTERRTPSSAPPRLVPAAVTPSPSKATTDLKLLTLSTPRATKTTLPSKRASSPDAPPVLRQEPWVLPLLVLSAISLVSIAAFEVFVLCKARHTAPSRRHLFLGQMLLLGVFMCAGLAALQTATPNASTCAVTRLGVGLAYALVFSSLLVKSVFLISLNGGVYLPAPYQALLLLFAVLIQVAVGTQWLLNSPPRIQQPHNLSSVAPTRPTPGSRHVITASDVTPVKGPRAADSRDAPLCGTPYAETLAALIYVVFLMGFVGILAAKSRGIRENYRESTYIGLSIACCAPLWLGWTLAGLALAPRHQDACLGFGLLITSVVVFSLMFLPRGRQLAAMGRDGRYAEDGGEERFSSLSPSAVAGYSPSFFHFKPAPPAPTLLPTKQGAPSLFPPHLMGDRVALVAPPPPPSYPRLLHYYPCLYYPPRYPGLYMKPDDGNMYTTLEPTLSSNPNVFFQRGGVHPGMMY